MYLLILGTANVAWETTALPLFHFGANHVVLSQATSLFISWSFLLPLLVTRLEGMR